MSIRGFSRIQIALHWIIAALVVVQVLVSPGMASAYSALENGESLSGWQVFLSRLHVLTGLSILLLVTIRLGVRIVEGAPHYLKDSVLKRMTRPGYLEQDAGNKDAGNKAAAAERPR